MILFVEVGKYQSLPVEVEEVFGDSCVKYEACTLWERLKQKLYLGIVAEGLEMSDSDGFLRYFFLI